MRKRIVVDRGEIKKISKDFKVTSKAVWEALVYRSNSSKARLIRKVALERGGVEIGDQRKRHEKKFYSSLEMNSKSISL